MMAALGWVLLIGCGFMCVVLGVYLVWTYFEERAEWEQGDYRPDGEDDHVRLLPPIDIELPRGPHARFP